MSGRSGNHEALKRQEKGNLGQCVYTMSSGRRCRKDATAVLQLGWESELVRPAYGYCTRHLLSVTKPRDPRIHRTAEPLTRCGLTQVDDDPGDPTDPNSCPDCGQPDGQHDETCMS